MATELVEALAHKIRAAVNETGRCLVTLPAEVAALRELGESDLQSFAHRHGWSVVVHLDGSPIEFFETKQV